MYAGTSGITFLPNIVDGSQPVAIFNSLDKPAESLGDLDIPNFYNKTEVGNLITSFSLVNYYIQNQVDAFISDTNLVDYYTKAEIDTQVTDYTAITYLQNNYMTTLSITEAFMNNYASISLLDGSVL